MKTYNKPSDYRPCILVLCTWQYHLEDICVEDLHEFHGFGNTIAIKSLQGNSLSHVTLQKNVVLACTYFLHGAFCGIPWRERDVSHP